MNSTSTKNIYGYKTPSIYKNDSNINADSSSPIKVRKKLTSVIKVNSLESFRLFRKSNKSKKKRIKNKEININYHLFISRNLFKYNSYPYFFYIKISNQLLFNFPNHLVSLFKDYLIWNENYDYIKNFNCLQNSMKLIPKIGIYYQTYTLFFPNFFPLRDLNFIIAKYIKHKKQLLEISENEYIQEEIKEIDKNIILNNTNIKKININNEQKDDLINNENTEKKLINSSEIKTENNCSISNYFGIDSVINCKDNSNFGNNNNFEKQIINYSLLNQIKKNFKNNKKENKINPNYSFELASIIQSFEENERNYYKNIRPKIKSCNKKKSKSFSKNKLFVKINKNKTNINFSYKSKLDKSKSKKENISVKDKKSNNQKKSHSKSSPSNKIVVSHKNSKSNNNIIKKRKENKYKIFFQNKLKNKSNDYYHEHYLTFNSEIINNKLNKFHINDIFRSEYSCNNIFNKYISKKNESNKMCILLHKNYKINSKEKDKKGFNFIQKKEKYKKLFTKSKESRNFKIRKHNNLTINGTYEFHSQRENEYVKIKIFPTLIINQNEKNSRNNRIDNFGRSQSQIYFLKNDFSKLYSKQLIFVNKKENNNASKDKKNENKENILSSSYTKINTFNGKNAFNKIFVNKKDNLKTMKKEKKINYPKNIKKINIEEINNLGLKNSLNNYKNILEKEYNTFIPKLVIKKMFFNKLKCEKNNINNKHSSLKIHNISTKNNQNTCSSSNANISKLNSNYKKNNEIKIPKTCSVNKNIYKNKRALTEFNELIKIFPKSTKHSPLKSVRKKKIKKILKISKLSLNEAASGIKNKNYFYNITSNTEKTNNSSKFHISLKEINNSKINKNLKKSFINKSNIKINFNIYNDYKINTESKKVKDKIIIKRKKITNNKTKPSYINKNKIHNLIQNTDIYNNCNKKPKVSYANANTKSKTIKNGNYSIDSAVVSRRRK